ncbi:MAG: Mu transposase domain-containing protein [Bacillota bacterium]
MEDNCCSVPYRLKEQVDGRYTAATVEIIHKGRRVASHARSYRKGTNPEHPPGTGSTSPPSASLTGPLAARGPGVDHQPGRCWPGCSRRLG